MLPQLVSRVLLAVRGQRVAVPTVVSESPWTLTRFNRQGRAASVERRPRLRVRLCSGARLLLMWVSWEGLVGARAGQEPMGKRRRRRFRDMGLWERCRRSGLAFALVAARSLVRHQTGSMARHRWSRERLLHGTLLVSRAVLRALRQSLGKRT